MERLASFERSFTPGAIGHCLERCCYARAPELYAGAHAHIRLRQSVAWDGDAGHGKQEYLSCPI